MRIGCFESCACISACYEFTKQTLMTTVIKIDEVRRDPEAFQKACIVIESIFQGVNFIRHTHDLTRFNRILDVT